MEKIEEYSCNIWGIIRNNNIDGIDHEVPLFLTNLRYGIYDLEKRANWRNRSWTEGWEKWKK